MRNKQQGGEQTKKQTNKKTKPTKPTKPNTPHTTL